MAKQTQNTSTTTEETQAPVVEDQAVQEAPVTENTQAPVVENTQPAEEPAPAPVQEEPAPAPVVEETQPAPAPEPAPTPTVTAAVSTTVAQVENQQEPAPTGFDALIAQIKESGTRAQKDLVNSLEHYMVNMKPGKPVNPDEGARHQYVLWKTITGITETAPVDEFKKLWSILLGYFNQYGKGVFHDRYVFRFSEFWQYDERQLAAFQRILNLLKLTANPKTRAMGLRQVDMNRTLADGFTEEGRQRIVGFYH